MRVPVRLTVACVAAAVVLILAACGGTTTARCPHLVNTSPGTVGTGQVSIATDHSVYAPGDAIWATITNHLSMSIFINNDNFTADCPYFVLQMQVGQGWQEMSACGPRSSETRTHNAQQRIAAGASFRTGVGLFSSPTGTYRLWLASGGYIIDDENSGGANRGTAASATFRVCTCAVCT